jgi:hypothetical protein
MSTFKEDKPKLTNAETIQLIQNLIDVESNDDIKNKLINTLEKIESSSVIDSFDTVSSTQNINSGHKFKM